jgi:hypothetical protein
MPNPRRLAQLLMGGALVAASLVGITASGGSPVARAGVLGQITPIPMTTCSPTSTVFVANLSSQQEVPPSGTGQTGTALMVLQPSRW